MKVVSIVVPIYRNASTLEVLYFKIVEVFDQMNDTLLELLFIDDGSDDASLELIQNLSTRDSRVCHFSFDKNYGQVAAIIAGLRHCSGDAAIVISADLQDPVCKIYEMIEAWISGNSIVICYRTSREDKLLDQFFSFAFYGIIHLKYNEIPIGGFDFFLLNRASINEFNQIERNYRFLQGDIVKLNGTKIYLPYERQARKSGKSQWTFFRKLQYAFTAINYK
jgi:glycosyltransferase involved in cell wall biosynthesis